MKPNQLISLAIGLLLLFLLGSSLYTVTEINQAIITRFGQPVGEPVRQRDG